MRLAPRMTGDRLEPAPGDSTGRPVAGSPLGHGRWSWLHTRPGPA